MAILGVDFAEEVAAQNLVLARLAERLPVKRGRFAVLNDNARDACLSAAALIRIAIAARPIRFNITDIICAKRAPYAKSNGERAPNLAGGQETSRGTPTIAERTLSIVL